MTTLDKSHTRLELMKLFIPLIASRLESTYPHEKVISEATRSVEVVLPFIESGDSEYVQRFNTLKNPAFDNAEE